MNRANFQELSKLRVREASALLDLGHFPGAYYLGGYAVECALKACIAKRTREHDFPELDAVREAWTHKLGQLIKAAVLLKEFEEEKQRNEVFAVNWSIVKDWSEEDRYKPSVSQKDAEDLLNACRDEQNGVLSWIEKRW